MGSIRQNDVVETAKIFFDCGFGYKDSDLRIIYPSLKNGRSRFEAELPDMCRAIRFVPVTSQICGFYNLEITIDGKKVDVKTSNGLMADNNILFESSRAEIHFSVPENAKHMMLEVSIIQLSSDRQTALESLLYSLRRDQQTIKAKNINLNKEYKRITRSTSWKVTKPLRKLSPIKKRLKENPYTHALGIKVKEVLWKSPNKELKKLRKRISQTQIRNGTILNPFTREQLNLQRYLTFPKMVKFSIIVPLYNTEIPLLYEMIQSVREQTYSNWELCLADGSDKQHLQVGVVCKVMSKIDKRIKYLKLEKNFGISGNSNAALDMASGDYVALLDHDDRLHPAALYEVMRAICEQNADFIYTDEAKTRKHVNDIFCPNFKPDFAPDTLRSYNYICHLSVFSRQLLERAGGCFHSEFDGSQDYDLILRLTEKAEKIVHIPMILYYWRYYSGSTAAGVSVKPYTITAGKKAVSAQLERLGLQGQVVDGRVPTTYHIQYEIEGTPLISIIIPNKDHIEELSKCITSIIEKSTYSNWELIIVENNSVEDLTFAYYEELRQNPKIQVVEWTGDFNYSDINNYGVQFAKGEHILLLNNDIEVISPDWMEQMLMFSQRGDIGAVGAMLYYPDNTVQHAGVIIGMGGVAGHAHHNFLRGNSGYMSRMAIAQNYSAVTGACMMIRKAVWKEVTGLDSVFKVGFNDVDLCMRIRKAGYLIAWTPFAELYHFESKSRGYEDNDERKTRFKGEVRLFQERWGKELKMGDPFYNPNCTLNGRAFSMKSL